MGIKAMIAGAATHLELQDVLMLPECETEGLLKAAHMHSRHEAPRHLCHLLNLQHSTARHSMALHITAQHSWHSHWHERDAALQG